MSKRHGCQKPTFHRAEEYEKTEGIFATQLSTSYDLKPHLWQEMVLNDWLAVDQDGKLIHNYCLLEVPRQNGKTGVSDPRETWGLVKRGESILHTAQEFQTAKKAFDRLRKKFGDRKNDPYAEYPELNALVDHYTRSSGQMVLDLINGGHIEFRTRGNNSDMGRGGTFDLVVIDEAQSYTEAQDAALAPLNSAAPSGSPQTILMGTPPMVASSEKGLIFTRAIHKFHENPEKSSCIHQWSIDAIDGVDDKDLWYRTNPSLGYQLLEEALTKDFLNMSEDTFAREHLGYIAKKREIVAYVIPEDKWNACYSTEPKPEGKTAYAVKFSMDGLMVCLCGAVIDSEGKARISLIKQESMAYGLKWLADWLNERYKQASCVIIDGKNGAGVLIDKISGVWKLKGTVQTASPQTIISAVGMLTDSISEGSLTWSDSPNQEILTNSATTSVKRNIHGGWGFGGDNAIPIECCALALFGAKTSKRDPTKRMRIG